MKVSKETFPFYEECKAKFGVDIDKGVVFTYGDTIHARCDIPPDLYEHEYVHSIQQEKMGKDLWWKVYLEDENFRLKQELEAYRAQYKYAKGDNREYNFGFLDKIAKDLSGKTYGNIISYKEACRLITA